MVEKVPRNIRGIPDAVFKQARIQALREGVSVGELVTKALEEYLAKIEKKEE